MRIIQSDCEVIYDGRGHTELARGIRLVLIKDDGTVIIHRTTGVKPTNYMGSVVDFDEYDNNDDNNVHIIRARSKKETLVIVNYNMIVDIRLPEIDDSADFDQIGTERQQQEWLSRNFQKVFGDENTFIMREFQTGDGACDLMGICDDGRIVLIEIKRKAVKKDVYQIIRYRDAVMKAVEENNTGILTQIPNERMNDISLQSFAYPHLVLASESISDDVSNECKQHGIRFVSTGTEWRHDCIPNAEARKNVNKTASNADNNDKQSLF